MTISNSDLQYKKYQEDILVNNLPNLSLLKIIETQELSLSFIIKNIIYGKKIMREEKDISLNDITTYQNYSSDEIKKEVIRYLLKK